MSQPPEKLKQTYNSASDIPSEWVQGIQLNGKRVDKQALEIKNDGKVHYYPDDGLLSISAGKMGEPENIGKPTPDHMGFIPDQFPLSGAQGFRAASRAAADKTDDQLHDTPKMIEIHIPRRHIRLPPATLRANKQFKQAIDDALHMPNDDSKFEALQNVFKDFGYYYPCWITVGGKFVYPPTKDSSLGRKARRKIKAVMEQKLDWKAFGGNVHLLTTASDIEGWFESTAKNQVFLATLEMNPTYSLLDDAISSEIERIYSIQYPPAPHPTNPPLYKYPETHPRIGTAKGIHFGGYLSNENVIELINEVDFSEILKDTTVAGKPRIECSVRRPMFGTSANLAFDRKLIKGTEKLKEAVRKALNTPTNDGKYQELQKVFGHFGYYYPSVVRLGGSAQFTECRDWIKTIRTNQTRIQFKSVKPLYELLDKDQQQQVKSVYDGNTEDMDSFPELTSGIHFDGTRVDEQAIELAKHDMFSKTLMLKTLSDYTNSQRIQRTTLTKLNFENYVSLEIKTYHELPGSYGFKAGAEAAYKERLQSCKQDSTKPGESFHVAYIAYKELHLHDDLIKASDGFKNSIDEALQAGPYDNDKYSALQNVFQRFGFYYPSTIVLGGRMIYNVDNDDCRDDRYKDSRTNTDEGPIIHEIDASEENSDLEGVGCSAETKEGSKCNAVDELAASLQKHHLREAIGGDSYLLLWNDVDGWIDSIKSNNVIVQLKGLKPLYELLDKDKRFQVQQIYESIILNDNSLCYNYSLETRICGQFMKNVQHNSSKTIHVSTESLYENLLKKPFSDSESATKYCHDACLESGFLVTEKKIKNKMVGFFCSHGYSPQNESHTPPTSQKQAHLCQWSIMLYTDDKNQWRFKNFPGSKESKHNHSLGFQTGESSLVPAKDAPGPVPAKDARGFIPAEAESPTSLDNDEEPKSAMIIKIVPGRPISMDDPTSRYVRYGDVVRLQYIQQDDGTRISGMEFIQASKLQLFNGSQLYLKDEYPFNGSNLNDTDVDFEWTVVPCLKHFDFDTSDESDSEEEYEATESSFSVSEAGTEGLDNYGYVRNGDAVLFKSQRTLDGPKKMYLDGHTSWFSIRLQQNSQEFIYNTAAWHIQAANECELSRKMEMLYSIETKNQKDLDYIKSKADGNDPYFLYIMGHTLLYGLRGLSVDRSGASEYLIKATSQGHHQAHHELGKLWWRMGKYSQAMDMLVKAAYLPVIEACRDLGDIYHAGFSSPNKDNSYVVIQDYKKAFMYYSMGGILGDSRSALMTGSYLEQGYHEDFGVDYYKALQWYELAKTQQGGDLADLKIGKLKHTMASKSKDPSEAERFRQEAYESFGAAAASDPSARLMVAVYTLNGWGGRTQDSALGFEILLGLTESGLRVALAGLAECYSQGIGVERNSDMASTFLKLSGQKGS
ncbi:hypothetical protein DFQ28_002564 [Apophysomyces sp. BC1034]|nr:hypothetical protein DFQ29_007192 [Apophysomyces sp. BC1021]KAG0193916.1 hypothetical protein DFQ28_002564 [Apophysomyces sp. BC1034]